MGHPSLTLCLALMSLLTLGCQPSVELPDEPSKPAASSESATPADTTAASEQPKQQPGSQKPSALSDGTNYGGAIAGAHRHANMMAASITFDNAIKNYHALNGEYPKSHEEFMKKLWEPLKSRMPDIDEGYRWQYDPETHKVEPVPIEGDE
ncbi:hypothetical protein NG895_26655 [Aeoliella sp. ICT_H6.2]|uniref:Uncharacterized protein n=1 Tax=Aeoliella straminimaris TaxID=2954799 RepID=A0A9X2JIV6_9BACT|nr:hypothetical protein [Aeoliella straminimaris]MCO6047500.1 hypothetical protein [Aeoliella straminimaris]